jgi:hypothetical protein
VEPPGGHAIPLEPPAFYSEEAEPRSPLLRSLVWMLVGIGLVGLVLFGAQKYLFNRNSEQPAAEAPPQTADNSTSKPSPVGQSQTPDDTAKAAPAPQSPPDATAPENSTPPAPRSTAPATAAPREAAETPSPRSQPEGAVASPAPKPGVAGQSVQFLTEPPGAQVTVDGSSSLACKTPCMLALTGGRHAVTVQLAGYRPYPRVFNVPQDGDLFLKLSKASGTLSITSEPSGATIEVDGMAEGKRTPAVFNLEPGTYHVKVSRSGASIDFDVQLRDGEFINKRVDF